MMQMNIFRTKLEATLTKGINELSRKRKHDSLGDDVVLTKRKRVDEPNTVPPAPPSTASDKIQPDASSPSAKTAHGTYGSTPIPAGSMEHAPVQLQYQTPAPPPGTESDKIQPDATSPSVKTTHGTYSSVPTSAGSMEHVQIHYQSSAPPPETASDKIQPGGSSYGTYSSAPISAGLISDAYERPVQIHYRPPPPPYGTASHKNQQDSSSASPRTSSYVAYGSAPTSGFERPVHIPYHPHVVQNNPSARLQQQGHIASSVGPFSPNTDPMHRTSYVMPPVPFDHQQRQLQQSQQYLQMHQDHDLFMQQQQQLRQAPQYLGYNFNQNPHHVAGQSFHMQHMEAFPSQSPRSAEPDPNYRI